MSTTEPRRVKVRQSDGAILIEKSAVVGAWERPTVEPRGGWWVKVGSVCRAPGHRMYASADIRGNERARAAHSQADAVASVTMLFPGFSS